MWWLAALLVPAAFAFWIAGHFLRARRQARASILSRGTKVAGEVLKVGGRWIEYAFVAPGWPQKITGRGQVPAGHGCEPGDRVVVRYLPSHPHINVIDPGDGAQV